MYLEFGELLNRLDRDRYLNLINSSFFPFLLSSLFFANPKVRNMLTALRATQTCKGVVDHLQSPKLFVCIPSMKKKTHRS